MNEAPRTPVTSDAGSPTSRAPADGGAQASVDKRSWALSRVIWVAAAMFVTIGLAGLFRSGPVGPREDHAAGNILRYFGVERLRWPSYIELSVPGFGAGHSAIELAISRGYLECMQIEPSHPSMLAERRAGDEVVYVFDSSSPRLLLTTKPHRVGLCEGHIRIGERAELEISQLVLP